MADEVADLYHANTGDYGPDHTRLGKSFSGAADKSTSKKPATTQIPTSASAPLPQTPTTSPNSSGRLDKPKGNPVNLRIEAVPYNSQDHYVAGSAVSTPTWGPVNPGFGFAPFVPTEHPNVHATKRREYDDVYDDVWALYDGDRWVQSEEVQLPKRTLTVLPPSPLKPKSKFSFRRLIDAPAPLRVERNPITRRKRSSRKEPSPTLPSPESRRNFDQSEIGLRPKRSIFSLRSSSLVETSPRSTSQLWKPSLTSLRSPGKHGRVNQSETSLGSSSYGSLKSPTTNRFRDASDSHLDNLVRITSSYLNYWPLTPSQITPPQLTQPHLSAVAEDSQEHSAEAPLHSPVPLLLPNFATRREPRKEVVKFARKRSDRKPESEADPTEDSAGHSLGTLFSLDTFLRTHSPSGRQISDPLGYTSGGHARPSLRSNSSDLNSVDTSRSRTISDKSTYSSQDGKPRPWCYHSPGFASPKRKEPIKKEPIKSPQFFAPRKARGRVSTGSIPSVSESKKSFELLAMPPKRGSTSTGDSGKPKSRKLQKSKPKKDVDDDENGKSKKDPLDEENVLLEDSPIGHIDLGAYFQNPQAWDILDESEKKSIRDLLPPSTPYDENGRPSLEFLKYNIDWRNATRQFQEDVRGGRYDPQWLHEAKIANIERANGEFDEWKEEQFEEFWGQKTKLNHRQFNAEMARITLEEMIEAEVFLPGDIWCYSRPFGKGKNAILVEKEVRVTARCDKDKLCFSMPPGQIKFEVHHRPLPTVMETPMSKQHSSPAGTVRDTSTKSMSSSGVSNMTVHADPFQVHPGNPYDPFANQPRKSTSTWLTVDSAGTSSTEYSSKPGSYMPELPTAPSLNTMIIGSIGPRPPDEEHPAFRGDGSPTPSFKQKSSSRSGSPVRKPVGSPPSRQTPHRNNEAEMESLKLSQLGLSATKSATSPELLSSGQPTPTPGSSMGALRSTLSDYDSNSRRPSGSTTHVVSTDSVPAGMSNYANNASTDSFTHTSSSLAELEKRILEVDGRTDQKKASRSLEVLWKSFTVKRDVEIQGTPVEKSLGTLWDVRMRYWLGKNPYIRVPKEDIADISQRAKTQEEKTKEPETGKRGSWETERTEYLTEKKDSGVGLHGVKRDETGKEKAGKDTTVLDDEKIQKLKTEEAQIIKGLGV